MWDAEASFLGRTLRSAAAAGRRRRLRRRLHDPAHDSLCRAITTWPASWPSAAGGVGALFAVPDLLVSPDFDPAEAVEQFPGVYRLLAEQMVLRRVL